MTGPIRHTPRDIAWETVEDGIFAAFQRTLCLEDAWYALPYLSDRTAAPDPHGFGYRKPWGEGLGLHPSRRIPAAHLMAFWTTDTGWGHWVAEDTTKATTGHGTLRKLAREARRVKAVHAIASDLAALDTRGRSVAVVLMPAAHTIQIYSDGDGARVSQRPSGNRLGSGPWPALQPLLQKPTHTLRCMDNV